jgi:hypothetical protein
VPPGGIVQHRLGSVRTQPLLFDLSAQERSFATLRDRTPSQFQPRSTRQHIEWLFSLFHVWHPALDVRRRRVGTTVLEKRKTIWLAVPDVVIP